MMPKSSNQKGQTLVIILFVMIVALTTGLALSSRFITTLSSHTETNLSYRAEAVALAGMERILLKSRQELEDHITFGDCGTDCILQITNDDGILETATITLSLLGNSSEPFLTSVSQDTSIEVNLNGYADNTPVTICWNDLGSGSPASLTGMVISGDSGNISGVAFAFNAVLSTESNGFDTTAASLGYDNCFSQDSGTVPQLLRVMALYNDVDIAIIPDASTQLPGQGILIESTGTVLDATHKVSAIKSENYLPPVFDYAVYNRSEVNDFSN